MTDKEMIEEMAKRLASWCEYGDFGYTNVVGLGELEFAKELLKYYQPKIPEGSVIVSKQVWEEHIEKREKANKIFEERVRKETAREILNAMLDIKPDFSLLDGCTPSEFMRSVNLATDIIFQAVKEQAKRYGVEVEL